MISVCSCTSMDMLYTCDIFLFPDGIAKLMCKGALFNWLKLSAYINSVFLKLSEI